MRKGSKILKLNLTFTAFALAIFPLSTKAHNSETQPSSNKLQLSQKDPIQEDLKRLKDELSGRTSKKKDPVETYENHIRYKYMDAIVHPGNVFCDPVVMAKIEITRNGRVSSAKITRSSGVPSWD